MRFARVVAACAALAVLGTIVLGSAGSSAVTPRRSAAVRQADSAHRSAPKPATPDGLGIAPGKIKHVWLIILENKSYDATFTGLNHNTYLWQTLPRQGVLLKNYYGTGHFSQDNYISLVSGQATESDTQDDCPFYNHFAGHVDRSGSLRTNPNYGQMTSAAGPNAAPGANGCVYPQRCPTLFNQLDAAHVSWKGYAQDLGNPDRRAAAPHSAGTNVLRRARSPSRARPAPPRSPTRAAPTPPTSTCPSTSRSRGSSRSCSRATATPSTSPTCSARATAWSTTSEHESTTPAFSWITPNNCSDAHDAVCHGNNLSGGFANPTTPQAAGQLHRRAVRRRPVPGARGPRDRSVAGVQGRRPDRHHLRRGVPAVHLHRQQLRQLNARGAQRHAPRSRTIPRARRCSATPCTPSRPGPTRRWRPTTRATSCTRVPVTTPSSTGRATASPRPRPKQPAGHLPAGRRRQRPRRAHRRRRHRRRGQLHDR